MKTLLCPYSVIRDSLLYLCARLSHYPCVVIRIALNLQRGSKQLFWDDGSQMVEVEGQLWC